MSKSLQVRLADDTHERMHQIARNQGISLANVLRNALEVHRILRGLRLEGKRIFFEKEGEHRVEIVIPGCIPKVGSGDKTGARP